MSGAVIGFLIAWAVSAAPAPSVEEEVRAAVKKLGGELVRDPALPGQPIVSVNL